MLNSTKFSTSKMQQSKALNLSMNEAQIIKEIENLEPVEVEPFVRIIQVGGGVDECALEGNPDGLRKMAVGLLRLSCGEKESGLEDLNHESSDVFFSYCSKRKGVAPTEAEEYRETIKDKIVLFFIILVVLSIPVFWVVGLIKSFTWIATKI